jgi:hypothetical protein
VARGREASGRTGGGTDTLQDVQGKLREALEKPREALGQFRDKLDRLFKSP